MADMPYTSESELLGGGGRGARLSDMGFESRAPVVGVT